MARKISLFLTALVLMSASSLSNASITVSLAPSDQTVTLGDQFNIALTITGLEGDAALGSFDISINFDAAHFEFLNASFGDPSQGDQLDFSSFGLNSPLALTGTGTVNLLETSLDPTELLISQQASGFTLATLTFSTLGEGSFPITLTINSLSDANGIELVGQTEPGNVTVASVPLPPSLLFFITGLVATLFRPKRLMLVNQYHA